MHYGICTKVYSRGTAQVKLQQLTISKLSIHVQYLIVHFHTTLLCSITQFSFCPTFDNGTQIKQVSLSLFFLNQGLLPWNGQIPLMGFLNSTQFVLNSFENSLNTKPSVCLNASSYTSNCPVQHDCIWIREKGKESILIQQSTKLKCTKTH